MRTAERPRKRADKAELRTGCKPIVTVMFSDEKIRHAIGKHMRMSGDGREARGACRNIWYPNINKNLENYFQTPASTPPSARYSEGIELSYTQLPVRTSSAIRHSVLHRGSREQE